MQKMSQLSGGQAVRVGLAAVAYAEPHLLVLVSLPIKKALTCQSSAFAAMLTLFPAPGSC